MSLCNISSPFNGFGLRRFGQPVLNIFDGVSRDWIVKKLETPESWHQALLQAKLDPNSPGAAYDKFKNFFDDKAYTLSAPTDWYVLQALKAVESVLPGLQKRYWTTYVSPSGSFIGSDSPVIIEGPKGVMQGFENAELISYCISRHVAIWGTLRPVRRELVNRKFIAKMNTLSMLMAEGQVFSHAPDFCWLDWNKKYQTDWGLFSKDKY